MASFVSISIVNDTIDFKDTQIMPRVCQTKNWIEYHLFDMDYVSYENCSLKI